MSEDCVFCRIIAGTLPATTVYEDERVIAIKDIHPKAPVHVLVMPRVHIPDLPAAASDCDLLAYLLGLLPAIAQSQGLRDGFRAIINTGPGGGQEVAHLHIHILGGGRLPGF